MTNTSEWTIPWEGLPEGWTLEQGLDAIEEALNPDGEQSATQTDIARFGVALTSLLLSKNRRYGDSALHPIELFAQGLTPQQRLGVRMDDKANRIIQGDESQDQEDPIVDLAGYLLLYLIAASKQN